MPSDTEAEYIPDQDDLDNPCKTCNGVYDGVVSMIQCSACKLWNHHKCVGNPVVSEREWWACPICVEAGKEKGAMPKIQNEAAKNVQKPRHVDNAPLASKISKLEQLMASQQELLNQLIVNRKSAGNEASSRDGGGERHKGNKSDQNRNSQSENRKSSNGKQGRNRRSKYFESSDSESEEPEDMNSRMPKYSGKQLSKYIAQQEMRELPIFDGSPTQWPVFYNTYIESKELFNNVTNRNRLQKALKGKALKAVAGLLLSPSTVDDAICMLEYRFGQTEQIIQEAIDHALKAEQPNERKPESIVDYAMLILTIK